MGPQKKSQKSKKKKQQQQHFSTPAWGYSKRNSNNKQPQMR